MRPYKISDLGSTRLAFVKIQKKISKKKKFSKNRSPVKALDPYYSQTAYILPDI